MALWGGRFEGGPNAEMQAFSESLGTDMLMWREDIAGSIAHVTMLGEVGILSTEEADTIRNGLRQVERDIEGGWTPSIDLEDIHMAVETRLGEHIGALAGKLHTARSRNDQVATDVRLWLRARVDVLDESLARLIGAICDRVESDGRTLVPGFTHLQRGQPIWLGHHLLAHAWSLSRDRERLADARKRIDRSPLGAAAMAGTPHPIDRVRSAELLDFGGVCENAMDAVAARDHLIEAVGAAAITMVHLSRIAEELVLWSSREFNWVRLGDAWSTGSSIMPQKRNPDAAELVRGKSGRVVGALNALITMTKGLPMAYNRDLQEDRVALFDAIHTTIACVRVTAGCFESMTVNGGPDLTGDFALTTELADFLAANGVPFREAHHVAGRLVKSCEARECNLADLTLADLKAEHDAFTAAALDWLQPEVAVERRTSRGGTAWVEVERQVALLRAQ
ncbi:MAG: argininosuccinate lyase [Myxococcota bacterium]|nr:argininosuccinate lyase [Myxococcota bacterium]MEC9391147.1 argininosuccinate lyase [Myxococcota bacterium]